MKKRPNVTKPKVATIWRKLAAKKAAGPVLTCPQCGSALALTAAPPPAKPADSGVKNRVRCQIEHIVKEVPSNWNHCPLDGGKLPVTSDPLDPSPYGAPPNVQKQCPLEGWVGSVPANWLYCPYCADLALLVPLNQSPS